MPTQEQQPPTPTHHCYYHVRESSELWRWYSIEEYKEIQLQKEIYENSSIVPWACLLLLCIFFIISCEKASKSETPSYTFIFWIFVSFLIVYGVYHLFI